MTCMRPCQQVIVCWTSHWWYRHAFAFSQKKGILVPPYVATNLAVTDGYLVGPLLWPYCIFFYSIQPCSHFHTSLLNFQWKKQRPFGHSFLSSVYVVWLSGVWWCLSQMNLVYFLRNPLRGMVDVLGIAATDLCGNFVRRTSRTKSSVVSGWQGLLLAVGVACRRVRAYVI